MIAFSHSSYGWDLAPRVAFALRAAQVSELVDVADGALVVPVCNAKLRRNVKVKTAKTVVTLQAGAFGLSEAPTGTPTVEKIGADAAGKAGIRRL
jgi:electron transfer flavoprotein alpha subunit